MARSSSCLPDSAERAVRASRSSKPEASRAIEYAARAGYFVKGFIYATIGVLAAMTALGFAGGRIVGTRSAVETIRSQPFGQAILWAVAIGLTGYVVWRVVQAFADPEHRGSDFKAMVQRVGLAISGLVYAALAVFTVRLLAGNGGQAAGGGDESQRSTAMLMQYEWGVWLVGLIGLSMIGVALYQAYRAYSIEFEKDWRTGEMGPIVLHWSVPLSRFGIAARAVAFALIGWFFLRAAIQADPSEARGLDGALRSFYDEPWGEVWLATVGIGFVCYGIYCALNGRFKRINP